MTSNISYISSACSVYCEGPILQTIQLSGIFNDSKTFVDMPMIYDPDQTLTAFGEIPDLSNKTALETFLNDYFLPAGSDLDPWVPTDYTETPNILDRITDPGYYSWASDLNALWLVLGRQVNESVLENPQRHSFVPRNYPMMVPGGRFRESYYWDSWWIIRGLLVCDMHETALNVINNLLDDIANFGFVPNGGRIYYIDRSQPPVLSEMVADYYAYMEAHFGESPSLRSFLSDAYESLQQEYHWWMSNASGHTVTMPDGSILNRYYSNYSTPRPESYAEDYQNTSVPGGVTEQYAEFYYHNKRAGAESGWDYTSRWLSAPQYNLSSVQTVDIVPVDLNSIMYRFELNLANIGAIVDSFSSEGRRNLRAASRQSLNSAENMVSSMEVSSTSAWQNYTDAAVKRHSSIQTYLWDETAYHWWDYNVTSRAFDKLGHEDGTAVSIASWLPLWANILPVSATSEDRETVASSLVASLQNSQLVQAAGVLTTTLSTGEQWDSPNAWPPLVWFTIEGLNQLATVEALDLAQTITTRWLNTCMVAYNTTGYMYEKYNAYQVGVGGGGGEYEPQIGFGWSNAVVLMLLNDMYPPVATPTGGDGGNGDSGLAGWAVAVIIVAVLLSAVVVGYCMFNRWRATQSDMERASEKNALRMNSHVSSVPDDDTSGGKK